VEDNPNPKGIAMNAFHKDFMKTYYPNFWSTPRIEPKRDIRVRQFHVFARARYVK